MVQMLEYWFTNVGQTFTFWNQIHCLVVDNLNVQLAPFLVNSQLIWNNFRKSPGIAIRFRELSIKFQLMIFCFLICKLNLPAAFHLYLILIANQLTSKKCWIAITLNACIYDSCWKSHDVLRFEGLSFSFAAVVYLFTIWICICWLRSPLN